MVMLLFGICNFMMFKRKFNELIVGIIYGQFMLCISDIVGALLVMLTFKISSTAISEDIFLTSCGNVLISLIFVFISTLSFSKNIYSRLVDLTNKINIPFLMKVSLLAIISINFFMVAMYYKINSLFAIIVNSTLMLIYSYILYKSIIEKRDNIVIKAENDALMENLSEYENMLDRQRIDNHENKNQLLIIKNMIKKNDKNVIKYIDTIVKDEKEDDEILYTKVKKIPSGGLQGIIYQKMLVMKDKNINFNIDVSRDVRKIDLENFDMSENYKLCKIIGVFLDNAIEESNNIDDKHIMISLYEEDGMLVIDISNKFNGVIDLECIDNEGYTTKGEGHGYGLPLVKKLISESNCFINERKINNDIFKQTIKVKIK